MVALGHVGGSGRRGGDARAASRLTSWRNLLRAASAKKISVAIVREVRKARRGRGLPREPRGRPKGGSGPAWNVCQRGWMSKGGRTAGSAAGKSTATEAVIAHRRLGLGQWRCRDARREASVAGRRRREVTWEWMCSNLVCMVVRGKSRPEKMIKNRYGGA